MNEWLKSYELFEQKFDKNVIEAIENIYKCIPILRAQAEVKYGDNDFEINASVRRTLNAVCVGMTRNEVHCDYSKYPSDNQMRMTVEFDVDGHSEIIYMHEYIKMSQFKTWLSQRDEFNIKLIDMNGEEKEETLADWLYENYFENTNPYIVSKDEINGFSINISEVNQELKAQNYRPITVTKIEYRVMNEINTQENKKEDNLENLSFDDLAHTLIKDYLDREGYSYTNEDIQEITDIYADMQEFDFDGNMTTGNSVDEINDWLRHTNEIGNYFENKEQDERDDI